MNKMLDPKWHTPVMINNYEVVKEPLHTTPHSGELHNEILPDQLARFSSNQLESFRFFHLCNTWNMHREETDKMWYCYQGCLAQWRNKSSKIRRLCKRSSQYDC